jgi:superfamily I DNA/RNA helicase
MTNPTWVTNLTASNTLTFTAEQQDIIDSTESTVLVNAVAGSGKTSVLMEIAKKSSNGLYLAFNKAIVKDVIPKLPLGWSCKTFNAFGLRMVYQNIPKVQVDFNKYSKLFGKSPSVHLAQKHMVLGGNVTDKSWEETCRRFTISSSLISGAKKYLKAGLEETSLVSGDEMLEYPIQNGWKSDHYDVVLVDECQDLNPQQIKFLSCIPTNRIIFVGDMNQAIYGFRGSDPYAIDMIKEQYVPKEYPMNESFRCPVEILQQVNHIVPSITSRKRGGSILHANKSNVIYPDECFVTSRTNASLIRLAHTLISSNQHFAISALFVNSLKSRLDPVLARSATIDDVRKLLDYNFNADISRYNQLNWNTANMIDRYKGLITIANNCKSIAEIKNFIGKMKLHTNSGSTRKLITIHAAKGLEAEHVFFLDPDTCDYFKKKTNIKWERQQEDNLYYVACTRALKTLTLVR